MIRKSTTQVRAISGNTPEETAALFNETMMELSQLHPTYERDGKMFWIFYNVVVEEPETTEEVYEMQGKGAYCIDCPFCSRDLNRFGEPHGRKKVGYLHQDRRKSLHQFKGLRSLLRDACGRG